MSGPRAGALREWGGGGGGQPGKRVPLLRRRLCSPPRRRVAANPFAKEKGSKDQAGRFASLSVYCFFLPEFISGLTASEARTRRDFCRRIRQRDLAVANFSAVVSASHNAMEQFLGDFQYLVLKMGETKRGASQARGNGQRQPCSRQGLAAGWQRGRAEIRHRRAYIPKRNATGFQQLIFSTMLLFTRFS